MSFISYSQNFEDVMLWRALKDIGQGFYIDVGANDPVVDSITKAFYDKGWRGINIEPLPSHYHDLTREIAEDINLQCAAGEFKGELEIWEADVRGWATISQEVILRHVGEGHKGVFHKVPVVPLAEICETYASSREIHFLKIDVEGFEKSVISGMDLSRFRPWIIVVESTEPNSTTENYQLWEPMLVTHNYSLAYADGLNRFYVAEECSYLAERLHYPPNVFDGFMLSGSASHSFYKLIETKIHEAEKRVSQAEKRADEELRQMRNETTILKEELNRLEGRVRQTDATLLAIVNSFSWKLTYPLRVISSTFRRIFRL